MLIYVDRFEDKSLGTMTNQPDTFRRSYSRKVEVVTEVVDRGTKLFANCQGATRLQTSQSSVEDEHKKLGSEAVTQKSRLQQRTGQVSASLHTSKLEQLG